MCAGRSDSPAPPDVTVYCELRKEQAMNEIGIEIGKSHYLYSPDVGSHQET